MFQLCIKVVRIYIHILFESVHIIFKVFKTLYTEKNKGDKIWNSYVTKNAKTCIIHKHFTIYFSFILMSP